MPLLLLRVTFVLVGLGLAVSFLQSSAMPEGPAWLSWLIVGLGAGVPLAAIGIDLAVRRKRLDVVSSIYFGLIVGLLLAYVARLALTPWGIPARYETLFNLALASLLCYTCISLLLQTREDFRFLIPYVEFSRSVKQLRPWVLDTSAVIDGRIADVVQTRVVEGRLVVPRFVVAELQGIADSSDKTRRVRGRRGLDILDRLRTMPGVTLEFFDRDLPEFAGQTVDQKLIHLARFLGGKVVTNDFNLNKVARLDGVEVVNLNDVAMALRPALLPGERCEVRMVRPGEQAGQGIGFLDDGTMVVVEGGREHLDQLLRVQVTSVTQTSAGRMIFGRAEGRAAPAESPAARS